MDKEIIKFEKYKFQQHKKPISIENNKIVASIEVSFSKKDFKYFIGY